MTEVTDGSLIEARDLCKSYGNVTALRGLKLRFSCGDAVGLFEGLV